MPCVCVHLPDGTIALVKVAPKPARRCSVCRQLTRHAKLCDYPTGLGKTCDAALCSKCAAHHAHDIDYCPQHEREFQASMKQEVPR